MTGEHKLWTAVLARAFQDAFGTNEWKGDVTRKQEARDWFEEDGEDLQEVCELVGRDPAEVRATYHRRLAEGWTAPRKGGLQEDAA